MIWGWGLQKCGKPQIVRYRSNAAGAHVSPFLAMGDIRHSPKIKVEEPGGPLKEVIERMYHSSQAKVDTHSCVL